MRIADCQIVGAMVAPRGKAPFDRAGVVVRSSEDPDAYLQVRAYVGPDEIEGKPLGPEEWQALVRSEQAITIEPVDAASGVAFWVLRSGFEGREAAIETLRTSGELLHDVLRLADGTFGFLVREPAANRLRDEWAAEASTKALEWAGAHHWDRAREAATRAFVLERAMSPERIAMLALAHARCGNETRAHGYVEMAKRSRGSDFAAQVAEKRTDLEEKLREAAPASGVRPRWSADIYKGNVKAMRAGLERLKRAG